MTRACLDCAQPLQSRYPRPSATGYCKACSPRHKWTTASRAKLAAHKRADWAKRLADPVERAKAMESGSRLRAAYPSTPDVVAKQIATRSRKFWCPLEYRDLNRSLKAKGYNLAERKDLIAAEVAKDERRAAQARIEVERKRPLLERQLERVRNGAKLVERFVPPTRDHSFTIGGVASYG